MNLAMIKSITIIIFLVISSVFDIRKKIVPLVLIALAGVLVLLLSLFDPHMSWTGSFIGTLLGLLLLLLGKLFKGTIGAADGLVMVLVGFVMGIYGGCVVLFYSLFLAAVFSIVLLSAKKVSKKDSIPFIPFILVTYVGVYLT